MRHGPWSPHNFRTRRNKWNTMNLWINVANMPGIHQARHTSVTMTKQIDCKWTCISHGRCVRVCFLNHVWKCWFYVLNLTYHSLCLYARFAIIQRLVFWKSKLRKLFLKSLRNFGMPIVTIKQLNGIEWTLIIIVGKHPHRYCALIIAHLRVVGPICRPPSLTPPAMPWK